MKLFMTKILKLIDDDLCLISDLYSCQVERKQKYLIEVFSEEAIVNIYNHNPYFRNIANFEDFGNY